MVKELEKLIKIVGEGNLLEAVFIFLGSFQHFNLDHNGGFKRNFKGLSAFIKKEEEQLDRYLNLAFSLQGLFLIYVRAYEILKEDKDNQFSTHEVIDKICEINNHGLIERKVVNQGQLTENQKNLRFLNLLGNPKRESVFSTEEDFANKVLTDIKKLLNAENVSTAFNNYDKEFALNKYVIDCYYSIHKDIKVDKDVALLFSITGDYRKLSEHNKRSIKEEILPITNNVIIFMYIISLAGLLQSINPSDGDKNRSTKYILNQEALQGKKRLFNISIGMGNVLCPKNTDSTMKRLLKNQSSDEFERRVTDPKNIHDIVSQEEYVYTLSSHHKKRKEKYQSTACRLILGVFVLSVGLCVVDYFLMEQKLLQSVKDILPQDNLTNLVVASILTIIILSALVQLLKPQQQSPKHEMKEVFVDNGNLANGYIPR